MKDVLETVEYRGFTVNILPDLDCENPLTACDHPDGFLFYTATRRDPGHLWVGSSDDEPVGGADDFLSSFARGQNPEWDTHYWLPIYKFDHSGVAYNNVGFICPWDSGLVGLVAVPKSVAEKEWPNNPREGAEKYMQGVTEEFSFWANGQCFGYTIEGPADFNLDSCWGFIGDDFDYAITEAKSQIDYYFENNASAPEYLQAVWRQAVADQETELGFEEWLKIKA